MFQVNVPFLFPLKTSENRGRTCFYLILLLVLLKVSLPVIGTILWTIFDNAFGIHEITSPSANKLLNLHCLKYSRERCLLTKDNRGLRHNSYKTFPFTSNECILGLVWHINKVTLSCNCINFAWTCMFLGVA